MCDPLRLLLDFVKLKICFFLYVLQTSIVSNLLRHGANPTLLNCNQDKPSGNTFNEHIHKIYYVSTDIEKTLQLDGATRPIKCEVISQKRKDNNFVIDVNIEVF